MDRNPFGKRLRTGRDERSPAARVARPRRRALLELLALAGGAAVALAVCAAAMLVPAPTGAVPFVVAMSVGCPLLAGYGSASALASLRDDRAEHRALSSLRAALDGLPETEHPLGL
jgi:hypothetical protein